MLLSIALMRALPKRPCRRVPAPPETRCPATFPQLLRRRHRRPRQARCGFALPPAPHWMRQSGVRWKSWSLGVETATHFAFDRCGTAALLGKAVNLREAESRSQTNFFGRVKGLECARQNFCCPTSGTPSCLGDRVQSVPLQVVKEGFTLIEKPYRRDVLAGSLRAATERGKCAESKAEPLEPLSRT